MATPRDQQQQAVGVFLHNPWNRHQPFFPDRIGHIQGVDFQLARAREHLQS
jgi:hypothetical protein